MVLYSYEFFFKIWRYCTMDTSSYIDRLIPCLVSEFKVSLSFKKGSAMPRCLCSWKMNDQNFPLALSICWHIDLCFFYLIHAFTLRLTKNDCFKQFIYSVVGWTFCVFFILWMTKLLDEQLQHFPIWCCYMAHHEWCAKKYKFLLD